MAINIKQAVIQGYFRKALDSASTKGISERPKALRDILLYLSELAATEKITDEVFQSLVDKVCDMHREKIIKDSLEGFAELFMENTAQMFVEGVTKTFANYPNKLQRGT